MQESVPVAGVVFAQELDISGYFRVGADVLGGSSPALEKGKDALYQEGDTDLYSGVTGYRGRVNFSATNEDETFGGFLRLQQSMGKDFGIELAWVWWQPIQQVKFQAGLLDDFYVDDIVNTFGGNAEETGVHNTGTNGFDGLLVGNAAFGQEFDQGGAALSLYPVEGLAINLGIPFANYTDGFDSDGKYHYSAKDVFAGYMESKGTFVYNPITDSFNVSANASGDAATGLLAQVTYDLTDIGRVSFAFRAHDGGFYYNKDGDIAGVPLSFSNHALYLGFNLTAIENMGLNFGVKFTLPYTFKYSDAFMYGYFGEDTTYMAPVLIGLGFNYSMDALGIGARLAVALGENANNSDWDDPWKGDTVFGLQILPSYDLGVCKIFLNAGVTIVAPGDNEGDERKAKVGFHINPYVEKTIGGGSFFVGFDLYSNGTFGEDGGDVKEAPVFWRIPCGMKFSF